MDFIAVLDNNHVVALACEVYIFERLFIAQYLAERLENAKQTTPNLEYYSPGALLQKM
jgi:hypothetical protein